MQHDILLQTWNQTHTFVKQTLGMLSDDNLGYKLHPNTSSAGFWLQHMAESGVLLLNVFFGANTTFSGVTLNGAHDEGQTGNTAFINGLWEQFDLHVQTALQQASANPHMHTYDSFLGPKTAAEALAIINYHPCYHLGQATLALKKGRVWEPALVAA